MSNPDSPADAAQFWHRRAALLAAKLNFHHWLARFIPLFFFAAIFCALFDLLRREIGWSFADSEALLLLSTAIAAAWAWLRVRAHFCSTTQALVRLETILVLHNQLSSARAGVLRWPPPRAAIDDGFDVNWRQILVPLFAGLVFLASAHFIPIGKMRLAAHAMPITAPPEFAQVQSWINALKSDDLIEPEKLQEMQSALDKLRDRPAQNWYTQSNLEAANSLKELAEQSMNTLAQDLDAADQTVQSMQEKVDSSADSSSLQPLQDKLREAGENLASGNLPLNRELVSKMANAGNGADKALTAKQLEQLHQQLQKGKVAARTAMKSGGGMSDEMEDAMMMAEMGGGRGRHGGGPGAGGRGGGESTAPLELQARDKTTPEGPRSTLGSDDMSHVALGETVKVSAGDHKVDPTQYHGNQDAGAAKVTGSGGESVWRSTYDPQEADVLSRFFK